MLKEIVSGVWLFEDTCNVYVVKVGERAVLVDFGSGRVLDHLSEIGVTAVDWVLHTHHHRDQCQGDELAVARGIRIAVPEHEVPFFAEASTYWAQRNSYHVYNTRTTFSTRRESLPIDAVLEDYATFSWGGLDFFVQPTPGHTLGHIALFVKIGGRTVAFVGDTISAPGKVATHYDLQFMYNQSSAVDFLIYSLEKMRDLAPDLACPSHGAPFEAAREGIAELALEMRGYMEFRYGEKASTDVRPVQISPHLLRIPGHSQTWIVKSKSGKALVVDYGSPSMPFLTSWQGIAEMGHRLRFLEHNLDVLRSEYGINKIDVAIPTHYHDDHVQGMPYLQKHQGTKIWVFETFADIMRRPNAYKLGCLHFQPLEPDRVLREAETFTWEEYTFQIFNIGGHTRYHMAMVGMVDGVKTLFIGDQASVRGTINVLGAEASKPRPPGLMLYDGEPDLMQVAIVYYNHLRAGDLPDGGRLLEDLGAELVCSGHRGEFRVTPRGWTAIRRWREEEELRLRALTTAPAFEVSIYPDWFFLSPYQPRVAPGGATEIEIQIENVWETEATVEWRVLAPAGWAVEPKAGSTTLAPGEHFRQPAILTVPPMDHPFPRRCAITADVTVNGRLLGEIAEAQVDLEPAYPL